MSIVDWVITGIAGVTSIFGTGYLLLIKFSQRNESDDIHANGKSIIVYNSGKGTVHVNHDSDILEDEADDGDKESPPAQETPPA